MGEFMEKPLRAMQGMATGGGILPDPIGDSILPNKSTAGAASPASEPAAGPATLLDPSTMPTLADQRNAKRKDMASQLARKGRSSTILTQDDGLGAKG